MNLPEFHTQHVFFASGSESDGLLFQQVVNELPYLVHLSRAMDGVDTLNILNQLPDLPDLLILDLELSIKNGLECLIHGSGSILPGGCKFSARANASSNSA